MKQALVLSLALLLCRPVLAQQFPDYIEKQIKSGAFTREEAKQLYPEKIIKVAPTVPTVAPQAPPSEDPTQKPKQYLAAVKKYMADKQLSLEPFGDKVDKILLDNAQNLCQSAVKNQTSVREVGGIYAQDMRKEGSMPPAFSDTLAAGIVLSIEKTKVCSTLLFLPARK